MNIRLLATPLVAATLLLSTLGCSKKDDPTVTTPTTANTGSYKRDGVAVASTASARYDSFQQNNQTVYVLYINLVESGQGVTDPRIATLEFQSIGSNSTGAFRLYQITYRQQYSPTLITTYPASTTVATVTSAGPSSFSGTFSGTGMLNYAVNTPSVLSDGVFTDAHL